MLKDPSPFEKISFSTLFLTKWLLMINWEYKSLSRKQKKVFLWLIDYNKLSDAKFLRTRSLTILFLLFHLGYEEGGVPIGMSNICYT